MLLICHVILEDNVIKGSYNRQRSLKVCQHRPSSVVIGIVVVQLCFQWLNSKISHFYLNHTLLLSLKQKACHAVTLKISNQLNIFHTHTHTHTHIQKKNPFRSVSKEISLVWQLICSKIIPIKFFFHAFFLYSCIFKNICIAELYVCQNYVHVKNMCMFEIYVCQKYMHIRNICACQKYMHVRNKCMLEIHARWKYIHIRNTHVCQKYMDVRNICMSQIYTCQKYVHVQNICILEIYMHVKNMHTRNINACPKYICMLPIYARIFRNIKQLNVFCRFSWLVLFGDENMKLF